MHVDKRMPVSNNKNTNRALMLALAAPFLPFNLTCLGFNHLILMPLKHRTPFKSSKINVRRWFHLFGSLALILSMCQGCSMQKRTTQSGWHVESAIWKQKRSPQAELAPSETPALKLPRHLPASSTLPLYTFKGELEQASKRVSETSSLPSSPVEFRPWIVDTLLSDTATNAPQDATRSQEVDLTPSAHSDADVTSDSADPNSIQIAGLITLMLGVGILPNPLGALLIAIGVIVFLVGRIVRLIKRRKSKGRGGRIFGNVLLMLLAGAFGVFATIVLLLESLFGEWTPLQDFFTWLFGG